MTIFVIGNVDYSDYVNKRNYSANEVDETISWKDANSRIHTTVERTRVNAKIELCFTSEAEHETFLGDISHFCEDGYWDIGLYINNKHEFKVIKVRIDITSKAIFGNKIVDGRPVVSVVTLNIEEV